MRSPDSSLLIRVRAEEATDVLHKMCERAKHLVPGGGTRRLPELVTYQIGETIKHHVLKSIVTSSRSSGTRLHVVNLPSHLAPPLELVTYSEAAFELGSDGKEGVARGKHACASPKDSSRQVQGKVTQEGGIEGSSSLGLAESAKGFRATSTSLPGSPAEDHPDRRDEK